MYGFIASLSEKERLTTNVYIYNLELNSDSLKLLVI